MIKPFENIPGSAAGADPLNTEDDNLQVFLAERPEIYQTSQFLENASPEALARFIASVHELVRDAMHYKEVAYPHATEREIAMFRDGARQSAGLFKAAMMQLTGTPGSYEHAAMVEQYDHRDKRASAIQNGEEYIGIND